MRQPTRLPSLDGIRALSIALVIVAHLMNTPGLEVSPELYFRLNLGRVGVRIFMVLSGFLITTLLVRELDRSGRIDLRRFYGRRAFRIFPAYYTFVIFLLVADTQGWLRFNDNDLWGAATFVSGYDINRTWVTGHLWSITVEEQFYLLWPPVLLWGGLRGGTRVLVGCLVVPPILRVALWWSHPEWQMFIHEGFPVVVDCLATGCLLAMYRHKLADVPVIRTLRRWPWMPVVWGLLGLWVFYQWYAHTAFYLVGWPALNLLVALFIDGCIEHPRRGLGPLLNAAPVAYVGTLSYSLYLWQQPFIDRTADGIIHRSPLNLVIPVAAAWLSYKLIEQPALRWRARVFKEGRGR